MKPNMMTENVNESLETITVSSNSLEKIINDFFEGHITKMIKYFQLSDMIESPIVLINHLNNSTKESCFKTQIISEYIKSHNMKKFANIRDIEIVDCMIDFVEETHKFSNELLSFEECVNIISCSNESSLVETMITIQNKLIKGYQLNESHKRNISFIFDMVICEIIKSIKINKNTLVPSSAQ
jgi:hypothetical protein